MSDGPEVEVVDPGEVGRVDGVQGKLIGDGGCGDHRVVGASMNFTTGVSQRGGNRTERPGRLCVEWKRLEVGFRLLEHRLPSGSLLAARGHEWADRQLRQSDG